MGEPWQRDEVASPCVALCVIHRESGFCIGCHRTGDEIARWSAMPAAERQALLAALPAREGALRGKRRGGRKRRV